MSQKGCVRKVGGKEACTPSSPSEEVPGDPEKGVKKGNIKQFQNSLETQRVRGNPPGGGAFLLFGRAGWSLAPRDGPKERHVKQRPVRRLWDDGHRIMPKKSRGWWMQP